MIFFGEIFWCLLFIFHASAEYSFESRDEPPLCAVQCGAMTRSKFRRKCPLSSESCVCSFIDTYTLCAVGKCNGPDRAAAIGVPISFFVPESMLISDNDFEPICLQGKMIIDSNDDSGEKKESENTSEDSASEFKTSFAGDGVIITSDRNGRIIAKVEDEESVLLDSHFKPLMARARVGSVQAGVNINNAVSTGRLRGPRFSIAGTLIALIIYVLL